MDINEANKMSVTALFSKLTSRFEFGAGKGFAGFLSRMGETGLRSGASEGASQSSPVENKVSKPRSVDLSEDKARNVSSENQVEDKIKNKKTARSDSGDKTVSDKSASAVAEESSKIRENKNAALEDVEYNAQVVIPVVQNLNLTAEAGEGDSFDAALAVDGTMADGAVFKGADTAAGEAEVLPSGVVVFEEKNVENNEKVLDFAASQVNAVLGDDVALPENAAGLLSAVNDVFGEDVGQKNLTFSGEWEVAEQKQPALKDVFETTVPAKNDAAVLKNEPTEIKVSDSENVSDKSVVVAASDNENVSEEKVGVDIKTFTRQVASEPSADLQGDVKETAVDKDAEEQAAHLEKILNGEQLKVSVDVKEEKIAEHAGRNLIKDRLALDEVVSELENGGSEPLSESVADQNVSSFSVKTTEISQPQVVAAPQQVAVADDVVAKGSAEISKIGTIATAGGNTAHAAGAGSSEYANTVRNQADSKANETSFRDVFKGISKEAVEQVKVNITKSAVKGIDSINVHLKPEELGRIEVKMQIKDGKLHAQIISSRPETMEALQREAQVLEKAFNDAGFQTDENSLTFSYRNEGQQAGQNQGRENPLRSFIGEVFETEANGELLGAEAANQNWSAEKGLNIRV